MTQTSHSKNSKTNKKVAYTIISIGLILVFSVAVFTLLFQANNAPNLSTQNQPTVKITNFSINKGWSCVSGLVMDSSFNLTIENKGADNVTDLVLDIKMFHNNSELQIGNYFDGTSENGTITEPIKAGEVKEFRGTIMSIVGDEAYQYLSSNDTSIVAFVTLDNIILDQRRSE